MASDSYLDIGTGAVNPRLEPVDGAPRERPARPVRAEAYGLPHKDIRGQGGWRRPNDGLGDEVSRATAVRYDDGSKASTDKTRQEHADSADILYQLRRFGVVPGNTRLPQYAEVDYDIDLLRAHEAVSEARSAIARLPEELLNEHGGVDGVMRAIERGELVTLDPEPEPAKPVDPPVGGAGGSLPPDPATKPAA